jgi:hypothetical protein
MLLQMPRFSTFIHKIDEFITSASLISSSLCLHSVLLIACDLYHIITRGLIFESSTLYHN